MTIRHIVSLPLENLNFCLDSKPNSLLLALADFISGLILKRLKPIVRKFANYLFVDRELQFAILHPTVRLVR